MVGDKDLARLLPLMNRFYRNPQPTAPGADDRGRRGPGGGCRPSSRARLILATRASVFCHASALSISRNDFDRQQRRTKARLRKEMFCPNQNQNRTTGLMIAIAECEKIWVFFMWLYIGYDVEPRWGGWKCTVRGMRKIKGGQCNESSSRSWQV